MVDLVAVVVPVLMVAPVAASTVATSTKFPKPVMAVHPTLTMNFLIFNCIVILTLT